MKIRIITIVISLAAWWSVAPTMGGEQWCVDVATYHTMEEASQALAKLAGREGVKIDRQGGKYVISMGYFPSEKEASVKWEQVRRQFPESRIRRCDENPSVADDGAGQALYDGAVAKRNRGDYQGAVADFRQLMEITKSPRITLRARYEMAHCYLALGQKEVAYETYRKAIEEGPEMGIAPADVMAEVAYAAYKRKDFRQSIKVYSAYGSLYPANKAQSEYFIACSLLELKEYRRALFLFDKIVHDYPSTPFAQESILALGNIGLLRPKVKVPLSIDHFDYVWYPITAYDEMLKRDLPPERKEELLISKANAYMILGHPEMAHRVLVTCLRQYAASANAITYRNAIARNLPAAIRACEERKNYLGVVGIFFQSQALYIPFPTDVTSIAAIVRALTQLGLADEARVFLKATRVKVAAKDVPEIDRMLADVSRPPERPAIKTCEEVIKEYEAIKGTGTEPSPSLVMSVADCKFRAGDYAGSIPHYTMVIDRSKDAGERNWAHLRLGQAFYRMGKKEEAKGKLEALKGETGDEFWSRLAEYAYEDEQWKESYPIISQGRLPGMTSPLP